MGALTRVAAYATWIVFALALGGCAGLGGGSGADADRVVNLITTDNVGGVRGAIESGRLNANQRVATEGYPDGAPIIAIAARAASLDVLRFLISVGADVNARTPVQETPLMLASYFLRRHVVGAARVRAARAGGPASGGGGRGSREPSSPLHAAFVCRVSGQRAGGSLSRRARRSRECRRAKRRHVHQHPAHDGGDSGARADRASCF